MSANPPTVRALHRLVAPVWSGCSPLLAFVFALLLGGLAVNVIQGWTSITADELWLSAFLLVSVYAATDPGRPQTGLGRASTVLLVLLGIGAALLEVYWIRIDGGQIASPVTIPYTITLAVLGVLAILARIIANRQLGQHQSRHEQ